MTLYISVERHADSVHMTEGRSILDIVVLQKRLHMRHQNQAFGAGHYEKPSTGYGDLETILLAGAYAAFSGICCHRWQKKN